MHGVHLTEVALEDTAGLGARADGLRGLAAGNFRHGLVAFGLSHFVDLGLELSDLCVV